MDTIEDLPTVSPELLAEEFEKLAKALRSGRYTAKAHIEPEATAVRAAPLGSGIRSTDYKLVVHAEIIRKKQATDAPVSR